MTLYSLSSPGLLDCDAVWWYGRIPTFRMTLATSTFTSPWRRRQHGPPKRWYLTTMLYGVATRKTSTWSAFWLKFLR